MHLHRESEIRGHPVGDVVPVVTPIVAPVQPPVILKEESPWTAGVVNHFVHTLPELGISMFFRQKLGTDTGIPCAPALASVVRAINPSGRHCDQHPPRVFRIEDDRVQAEPSATRLPLGLMLVIEQSLIWLPAFSTIA